MPLDLLHTHDTDALPTCLYSSQQENKRWEMIERSGELEIPVERSMDHGGVNERARQVIKGDNREGMVSGKSERGDKGGGDEQRDRGEAQDSPVGPVVELKAPRLDVGAEEVTLTGGGEDLAPGIMGIFGGNKSVSVTSSSNGSE